MSILNANAVERLRWPVRCLLGGCLAALAFGLNYGIQPLRMYPFLLAFPTVVLAGWFLGMRGAIGSALTAAVLVDLFLTKETGLLKIGNAPQAVRLLIFLAISLLLGWAIRRLSEQRAQIANQDLKQQLSLAEIRREIAEERARSSEELRERDEMLQIALRANGMGLWVWDLKDGIMHRSDEIYRMTGREPGAFGHEPEAWLQLVHPDDLKGMMETWEHTLADGRDYHKQYRVVWPDGSHRWLESQGKTQKDSDGKVVRVVGVMADITHRKQTEEAMLRAEKLAVAGRLAASVAHEINNPLEAVANMLYLITLTESAEDARKHSSDALNELMRVSLITQSTLKFHRQTGTPKNVLLSEMMDGVLTLFRGKLLANDITVDLQIGEEVEVACMPSETQQIFANLVANAIEAMPTKGRLAIRLRAGSSWRDRTQQGMRVTVCDSGPGMDREIMHRIFEPFFTTKQETGTGLGLWVVAQLVERHKGYVRVWSSRQEGACGAAFSVFLPLGEVYAEAVDGADQTPEVSGLEAGSREAPTPQ